MVPQEPPWKSATCTACGPCAALNRDKTQRPNWNFTAAGRRSRPGSASSRSAGPTWQGRSPAASAGCDDAGWCQWSGTWRGQGEQELARAACAPRRVGSPWASGARQLPEAGDSLPAPAPQQLLYLTLAKDSPGTSRSAWVPTALAQ